MTTVPWHTVSFEDKEKLIWLLGLHYKECQILPSGGLCEILPELTQEEWNQTLESWKRAHIEVENIINPPKRKQHRKKKTKTPSVKTVV